MTRYKTYQFDWGFMTIDSQTEEAPKDYIAGPFNVTIPEAEMIEKGATIEVVDDQVNVYHEVEVL